MLRFPVGCGLGGELDSFVHFFVVKRGRFLLFSTLVFQHLFELFLELPGPFLAVVGFPLEPGINDGFGLFSGFLLFLDFIAFFLLFFLVKLGDLFLLFGAAGESVLHFLEFPDRHLVDAFFQS